MSPTFEKQQMIGVIRNAARLMYEGAKSLEELWSDPENHLKASDVAEIKAALTVSASAVKDIRELLQPFEEEITRRREQLTKATCQ